MAHTQPTPLRNMFFFDTYIDESMFVSYYSSLPVVARRLAMERRNDAFLHLRVRAYRICPRLAVDQVKILLPCLVLTSEEHLNCGFGAVLPIIAQYICWVESMRVDLSYILYI